MHKTLTFLLFFFAGTALAQTPMLVKDINPGTGGSFPDSKEIPVAIGAVIYFSANDGVHGQELWRSDGTAAGTYMVKDIWPNSDGSAPVRFMVLDEHLLFFANDGVHGDELWVSDGTEAGTLLVKDINPGAGNAIRRNYLPQVRDRIIFRDAFYFAADTGPDYSQLWRSDGTEAGTQFVGDVCSGCDANNFSTGEFSILNDTLYLLGGSDLWRSDGTPAGTNRIFGDFDPGEPPLPKFITSANGLLYMSAGSNVFSQDLWASDGTKEGTRLVKDFDDTGQPHFFTEFANRVFFYSDENLWSTDGTEAGTQLESQLVAENPFQRKNNMMVWKDALYYRAKIADNSSYIYKTDGSPNGETQVYIQNFLASAMTVPVFFAANDKYLFYDVNSISPSIKGIVRIDSAGGVTGIPVGTVVENLVATENNLFFWTQNSAAGKELWKFPLTTSGLQTPSNELALNLYPTHSADGQFYLELDRREAAAVTVGVFDVTGKEWRRLSDFSGTTLQLGALPAGMYWIQVTTREGKYAVRKVTVGR